MIGARLAHGSKACGQLVLFRSKSKLSGANNGSDSSGFFGSNSRVHMLEMRASRSDIDGAIGPGLFLNSRPVSPVVLIRSSFSQRQRPPDRKRGCDNSFRSFRGIVRVQPRAETRAMKCGDFWNLNMELHTYEIKLNRDINAAKQARRRLDFKRSPLNFENDFL